MSRTPWWWRCFLLPQTAITTYLLRLPCMRRQAFSFPFVCLHIPRNYYLTLQQQHYLLPSYGVSWSVCIHIISAANICAWEVCADSLVVGLLLASAYVTVLFPVLSSIHLLQACKLDSFSPLSGYLVEWIGHYNQDQKVWVSISRNCSCVEVWHLF